MVEIPVLEPADLELDLQIQPPPPVPGVPGQSVEIAWNGTLLDSQVFMDGKSGTFRVSVPAEIQNVGTNLLSLMPLHWLQRTPGQCGPRNRGIEVKEIRLVSKDPETGAEGGRTPAVVGDAVAQPADTTLTGYVRLPDQARLSGVVTPALEHSDETTVGIEIRTADGRTVRWERAGLEEQGARIAIDLADLAGQAASVTLWVRSALGRPSGTVHWQLAVAGDYEMRPPATVKRTSAPPNILLVLFDALRADHLEPYGSTDVATPKLAEFAAGGVTFARAYANATWTKPSVTSLLTSLRPGAHGVRLSNSALPEQLPYLPEVLQNLGFRTVGVSDNAYISKASGFDRGFDHFYEHFRTGDAEVRRYSDSPEDRADWVWDRYIGPNISGANAPPFFVYLHEIDPHAPYTAPERFAAPYLRGYRGHLRSAPSGFGATLLLGAAINRYGGWMEPADISALRGLYAGEVSFMDAYFGRILQRLRETTSSENTLVVFVSDHGEEFLEHGVWGHGDTVFETATRVPLILSFPGVLPEGLVLEQPVQLADVMPTILDLVQQAEPKVQGQSLVSDIFGGIDRPRGPIYSLSKVAGEYVEAVILGSWKLHVRTQDRGGEPQESFQLYDLEHDPSERLNRWSDAPIIAGLLRQEWRRLEQMDSSWRPSSASVKPLDEETIRMLRDLGYAE